jgi:uncharacterized protein (DUF1501 family)
MTTAEAAPVLVVLQLSGGNDYLNTVIPYTDPFYRDNRPAVGIPEDRVLRLDDRVGLHPSMGPIRDLYDQERVAIIHGVGYENSPRSHFRSMDIWHTCEPDKLGTEGWLGRVIRDLDPNQENVVTAVSFGPSLFRALALPGVPVACVDDLENYGLLTGVTGEGQRARILDRYKRLYAPAIGSGPVMEFLGQTGLDALKGADVLSVAPGAYSSSVEYADTPIGRKLKGIAQIHLADLGTRIFYCDHGSFDSHSNQLGMHATLWKEVSDAIQDFFDDLREHDAADEVIMLIFSEFGRRTHDNGSGTDHGAAGAAFVIGDRVKGGQYGEYPSTKPEDLEQGDLVPNTDFRGLYSSILEDWLGLDAVSIVGGAFEKPGFLA